MESSSQIQEQEHKAAEDSATSELFYQTLLDIFKEWSEAEDSVNESIGFSKELCANLAASIAFESKCNFELDQVQQKYFFKGYFDRNAIFQLVKIFLLWNQNKQFPILFYTIDGFTEEDQSEIINSNNEKVMEVCEKLATNDPEFKNSLIELLIALKPRGVLTMLGMRKTKGSQDHLALPERQRLHEAFNELNSSTEKALTSKAKKGSILTVGARALCKHGHRGAEGFWGVITGKEAEKNQRAEVKAVKVMDNCIWMNLHILPHSEYILELRTIEGYGLRWTEKGVFRGLLEPPMEGGHEKGWKH